MPSHVWSDADGIAYGGFHHGGEASGLLPCIVREQGKTKIIIEGVVIQCHRVHGQYAYQQ